MNLTLDQTLDILKKALKLIKTKGWCKGALALNKNGDAVLPKSKAACKFCSTGAISRYTESNIPQRCLLAQIPLTYNGVVHYNDAPNTRKKSIIAMFNRAIKSLEYQKNKPYDPNYYQRPFA
jgi:hypothetical protein